jgi:hemoglobin
MPNQSTHLPLGPSNDDQPSAAPVTILEIRNLVERFYESAREDELLGPIFAERVEDWGSHYETMTRFWASAVLRTGTYSGRPIEKHRFGGLSTQHFLNWVERFAEVADEQLGPERSAVFIDLSQRMASSIAMRVGVGGVEQSLTDSP